MRPSDRAIAGRLGLEGLRAVLFDEEQIALRVAEMGEDITQRYPASESVIVLGLLKGSFIFLADLVRRIRRPLHVDFLMTASYGTGRASSGEFRFLYDPEADLRDRHVIVVEDIVDSGTTVSRVVPILEEREPRSLEICTLLHKRRVELEKEPIWVGFQAPQEFLVGYGLDHAEDFRHLPFIGCL